MSERRASPRIPGSTFHSLKVLCVRAGTEGSVVNISSSGALIECDTRLVPGDRQPLTVEVNGASIARVAAHILRAEVAQVAPNLTYRAAVLFAKPLGLDDLAERTVESSAYRLDPTGESLRVVPNLKSREQFEQEICRLLPIEAARVCQSLSDLPGCESIYFMIPADVPRYLQVFFTPTSSFSREHFLLLEQWARAAGTLPHEY